MSGLQSLYTGRDAEQIFISMHDFCGWWEKISDSGQRGPRTSKGVYDVVCARSCALGELCGSLSGYPEFSTIVECQVDQVSGNGFTLFQTVHVKSLTY